MKSENMLRYSILDPTGNITAIVESPVEIARQPELASRIMRLRPEVEQVGLRLAALGGKLRKAPTAWRGASSAATPP